MAAPRSLFLVALPRSLSTLVHGLCCRSVGLRSPAWADAGEVLNGDRVLLLAAALPHFLAPGDGAGAPLAEFLDDVVRSRGRAYKDVVQPFVLCPWLERRRDLAVLLLRRPVPDVAWAMIRQGWSFPERAGGAAGARDEPHDRLLRGLLRARRAHERLAAAVAAASLEFDDLLQDAEALPRALRQLYPELTPAPVPYLDDDFRRRRDEVLARRRGDDWRRLDERLQELAERPAGGA